MNATEEKSALLEELEPLMKERGIEDFEELHRRFAETEYAYIPVPGLHRGKPVSFEEFQRHINRERVFLYGEIIQGLAGALGLEQPRDDKEIAALVVAYVAGHRPSFRAA